MIQRLIRFIYGLFLVLIPFLLISFFGLEKTKANIFCGLVLVVCGFYYIYQAINEK